MKTTAFNYIFLTLLIVCIATGMMLHVDVNHKHIAGFTTTTCIHLAAVAAMLRMAFQHIRKHSKWFGAFAKLRWSKKTVNAVMSIIGTVVVVTPLPTSCQSPTTSPASSSRCWPWGTLSNE